MASSPVSETAPERPHPRALLVHIASRFAVLALIALLLGVVTVESSALWREWGQLQQEQGSYDSVKFVGYTDIMPLISYAQRPKNWIHDENQETLLWQRWVDRVGHRWFHIAQGELDPARITGSDYPFLPRPIDNPIVETAGGVVWGKIPQRVAVVGLTIENTPCVYPVTVLDSVRIINDVIRGRPYLILWDKHAPPQQAVSVYDANWNGRRATLATTGYYFDNHPLLYDRRSESLWVENGQGLVAFTGRAKGAKLVRVAQPAPSTWQEWQHNPGPVRLVVGADRSGGIPPE